MKLYRWLFLLIAALLAVAVSLSISMAQDSTPTPTEAFQLAPVTGTPTPSAPVAGTPELETDAPPFVPPPSLAKLIEEYPELGPYIDKIRAGVVKDIDIDELYTQIIQIYDEKGIDGVATFLSESGILEKLGIPLSYLDILIEYDHNGLDAAIKMARDRGIINDHDEIVAYLAIDSKDNLDEVTKSLTDLGVSVYDYLDDTDEVQIGIPLAILKQFKTPKEALDYLVEIANVPHALGIRAVVPDRTDAFNPTMALDSVGGDRIGTDKWNTAGFTGKGVRVGILDMGFGTVQQQIDSGDLPDNMVTNTDLSVLDSQPIDHGTACTMVVHRAAPDAQLYLAYYNSADTTSFVDALQWLKDNQVQIINFSAGSNVGPRDGTWGRAPLVDQFVRDTGILWVNAAGNAAASHSVWKYAEDNQGWALFGTSEQLRFTAYDTETDVILNWNGNWQGHEKSNYKIRVVDKSGNVVAVGNEPHNGRRYDYPYQVASFETVPRQRYYISIARTKGSVNNNLDIFVGPNAEFSPSVQVPGYSVSTPGDVASVLTVGATGLNDDQIEYYSSEGPTQDNRVKPDLSAPTGEVLPMYPEGFFGTSGAAPLTAGAAALVLQRFPSMTQEELKAYLMKNTVDLGDAGEDPVFGAGRLALEEPQGGPDITTSSDLTASVSTFKVNFGARLKGKNGIEAVLSFDVDNAKDHTLAPVLLFYDDQQQNLDSLDPTYVVLGTLGSAKKTTVTTNSASYSDVSLFLPYAAFPKMDKGRRLVYLVALLDITDANNIQRLWQSEPSLVIATGG